MEKPTWPWPVVSLKDAMGTMGRDPQISEKDIFGAGDFHSSAAKRANEMIFRIGILPSTRSIQKFNQNLMVLECFSKKAFSLHTSMSGMQWKNPPGLSL